MESLGRKLVRELSGTHKSICARMIREQGITEGLPVHQIAEAIYDRCGLTRLRAQRLARGWTLKRAVAELRSIHASVWGVEPALSHQRLSQWEIGSDMPSTEYLDALCRLYESRPDLLGFGNDYSPRSVEQESSGIFDYQLGRSNRLAFEVVPRTLSPQPAERESTTRGNDAESEDEMRRRDLMRAAVISGGLGVFPNLLGTLRQVRTRADLLLESQSVSAETVDHWESVVRDHGHFLISAPLYVFLVDAVCDFVQLRAVLGERQPLEYQRRLYRVMAQLAGLIATAVNAAGDSRETRSWFHTARLAANETGDRSLRAWVTAYEGMSYLWYGRSVDRARELAAMAQSLAGSQPSPAGALGAAIEARSLARHGRKREAAAALHRSEIIYGRLSATDAERNVLGFYEEKLGFYQSEILTSIGDSRAAMAAQQHVLQLFPPEYEIDPALVRLDAATCLIRTGELAHGCQTAGKALLMLSPQARNGLPNTRARDIMKVISARDRGLGAVRDLDEILRADAAARSR